MGLILPAISEPIFIQEVFASGFIVEKVSGVCVRLTFFTEQAAERIVVAKIIRPIPLLVAGDKLLKLAESYVPVLGLH